MKARGVIGANFGDEGKGRLTDFYSDESTVVVRHNGGAQAGHTVKTPAGQRHVFNHIGSGTFKGASTFLSRFFIVNPFLFDSELHRLGASLVEGKIIVDPLAHLTTPYDMLINEIVERKRGSRRHGSCGVGINETITRGDQRPDLLTRVLDIRDLSHLGQILDTIRFEYAPRRVEQLTGEKFDGHEYLSNENIKANYLASCERFLRFTREGDINVVKEFGSVVFEGAQGLLLDEDHRWFPYVTRSKTGVTNIVTLSDEAQIEELDITYVTRAYLTRHGVGPLPNEIFRRPYQGVVDETNITNEFQGSLRFAYLDLDLLNDSITNDDASAVSTSVNIIYDLAVTCMDQVGDEIHYLIDGEFASGTANDFIFDTMFATGSTSALLSYSDNGPLVKRSIRESMALAV